MNCLKSMFAMSLLAVSASLASQASSQPVGTGNMVDNTSMAWFAAQPKIESIVVDGKPVKYMTNFNNQLAADKFGWITQYQIMRPGLYQFLLLPKEMKSFSAVQVRRMMVPVYGQNGDWPKLEETGDQVFPLTEPFGQAAGKDFSAQVFFDGKPAANTVVAVEYYGAEDYQQAPETTKIVSLLRTNEKGIFNFTVPWQGWWGFTALKDLKDLHLKADYSPTVVGSVLWTKFVKP